MQPIFTLLAVTLIAVASSAATLRVNIDDTPEYEYLGCWKDDSAKRDVTGDSLTIEDGMTIDLCAHYCSTYKLFALQNGKTCFCGDTAMSYGESRTTLACSIPCNGNSVQTCGGVNANSLYAIASHSVARRDASDEVNSGSGSGSGSGNVDDNEGGLSQFVRVLEAGRVFVGSSDPFNMVFLFTTDLLGLESDDIEGLTSACADQCLDHDNCKAIVVSSEARVCNGLENVGGANLLGVVDESNTNVVSLLRVNTNPDDASAQYDLEFEGPTTFTTADDLSLHLFDFEGPSSKFPPSTGRADNTGTHLDDCAAVCLELAPICKGFVIYPGSSVTLERCVGLRQLGVVGGKTSSNGPISSFKQIGLLLRDTPTDAPTTAPVTPAPTSAPVTSAPTTPAPTSLAPTSNPTTTPAPVTSAPVIATSAPVTSAPVTSAPVTVTSAPATSAPTTSAPVVSSIVSCERRALVVGGGDCFCDDGCYLCNVADTAPNTQLSCAVCATGMFLSNGVCVEANECPAGSRGVGTSLRGNLCVSYPFECQGNDVADIADSPACPCSDSNCQRCQFTVAGEVCMICDNSMVLENGVCVATCTQNGNIVYGSGTVGLECHQQESCVHWVGLTPAGDRCMCDMYGDACRECTHGSTGSCSVCGENQFLQDGQCVATCTGGLVGVPASSALGGVCEEPVTAQPEPTSCRHWSILDDGSRCRCPDNCIVCGGDVCEQCNNFHVLVNGVCQASCPVGQVVTGTGAWGLSCAEPKTCRHWTDKITLADGSTERCICPSNCLECQFGVADSQCSACRNSKFLHEGDCIDSCPAGTDEFIPANTWNRVCVPSA